VNPVLGYVAAGSWTIAAGISLLPKRKQWLVDLFAMLGVIAGAILLTGLWITLDRPPMRTLGETRWWYAVCVPLLGVLLGWRFQTRVLMVPSLAMGAMFALINLQHPEYMDRTLMPALQSPWFVPHVVVYMLAYSALGLSSAVGAWNWGKRLLRREAVTDEDVDVPHRLVLIGLPMLTCGLLFGALWAKEAWGHYWTWDPKETWAFLTWMAYLIYLHLRQKKQTSPTVVLLALIVGFGVLMACWFGVNYLPTAKESVHTYTQS
jgi:ABC-type transport system involved in cytochrome c biogenesis permease subunit